MSLLHEGVGATVKPTTSPEVKVSNVATFVEIMNGVTKSDGK
jgi:hypothetical protein